MRKFSLTWGIILLIVGSLLLLDNLNVFAFLGVSIWNLIWPLGLIAFGVWILVVSRSVGEYGESQDIAIPGNGTEHYTVNVAYGAGELFINGAFGAQNLVQGTTHGGMKQTVKTSGESTTIHLSSPPFHGPWRFVNRRKWQLTLDGSLPCDLTLNTGACDAKIDLTDTMVQTLNLDTGASATRVKLPTQAGFTKVTSSGGAASLSIEVPPEVAAHIVVKGGLYSANVNRERFPRQGAYYESPDYAQAANKVEIRVDMGLGSVEIH